MASSELDDTDSTLGRLRDDVRAMEGMSSRHVSQPGNRRATDWLFARVAGMGLRPERDPFTFDGATLENVLARVAGTGPRSVLLLAHFDSIAEPPDLAPGADDNASGCAILLDLLRLFAESRAHSPLRPAFDLTVCFTNAEEPGQHGGRHLAKRYRSEGRRLDAVVNFDTLGTWPKPLGDGGALNFVTNDASRGLIDGLAGILPFSIEKAQEDWQDDHAMFWEQGYRAIEFTEPGCTKVMHSAGDTSEMLDFPSLARVCVGLRRALLDASWMDSGKR